MSKLKFAGLIFSLAVLGGCSSNPNNVEVVDVNNQRVEPAALNVPEWYLNLPSDSEEKIYAAGSGISSDLQFSLEKALHQAKVALGDKISNYVSSEFKTFISDNSTIGNNTTVEETQRVSKSGFKNIDISNYKVENKTIVKEEPNYRSFIMLSVEGVAKRKPALKKETSQADIDKAAQAARESLNSL
jgi:hypothetical protein